MLLRLILRQGTVPFYLDLLMEAGLRKLILKQTKARNGLVRPLLLHLRSPRLFLLPPEGFLDDPLHLGTAPSSASRLRVCCIPRLERLMT